MITYIDDILVIAVSKHQLYIEHLHALVHLLECLRFIINAQKSVLTQEWTIQFLDLTADSINMELRLLLAKIK